MGGEEPGRVLLREVGRSPERVLLLTRAGEILQFFLYDSAKILLLLFGMIGVIGVLRTYLPRQRVRAWLSGRSVASHAAAALFGAVTPFCSCSSIPIFIGLLSAGVPLGVAFAFLITSPLINEYLVVLMFGSFGWRIAVAYVVSGLALGLGCGLLLGRLGLERYLVADVAGVREDDPQDAAPRLAARVRFGLDEARSILVKIGPWVLAGVGVGAVIHNLVPAETIRALGGRAGVWARPVPPRVAGPR